MKCFFVKVVTCVVVMSILLSFAGVAFANIEIPLIVRKVVEYRDFFRDIRGVDNYRLYDVKSIGVEDASNRSAAQRMVGVMLYDELGYLFTMIFDRETKGILFTVSMELESKEVRERKMRESVTIKDAKNIADAAYKLGSGATIKITQNVSYTPVESAIEPAHEMAVEIDIIELVSAEASLVLNEQNGEIGEIESILANFRKQVEENEKKGMYENYDRKALLDSWRGV